MSRLTAKAWLSIAGAAALMALAGCGGSVQAGPEPNMTAALKIRAGFSAAGTGKTPGDEGGGVQLKRLEGWGTVKGRFILDGAVPAATKLTIDKDPEICGKQELFNESIKVNGKSIVNVVIYVRTPKIPVHDDYKQSAASSVVLDNKGCRFEPHVVNVRVGQTLVVHNADQVAHNTKVDGKALQGNPLIPPGGSVEFKVEASEPTPVATSCSIHPWMKGRVVVTTTPYCAVSKDDGSFELKNVPAGELELQIWQEAAPNGNLEVSNPKLQKTGAGRYKISLLPKEELNLNDIIVAAAALNAG
jgi:plastocyanin